MEDPITVDSQMLMDIRNAIKLLEKLNPSNPLLQFKPMVYSSGIQIISDELCALFYETYVQEDDDIEQGYVDYFAALEDALEDISTQSEQKTAEENLDTVPV